MAAANLPDWVEWAKALAPVGSWVIVIIGWMIVSKDNNKRELRKEIRAQVTEIGRMVDALVKEAAEYYCKPGSDPTTVTLALQIKRDLKRVSMAAQRLRAINAHFDVGDALTELRQHVSGGGFDSAERPPCAPGDHKHYEIADAAANFTDQLERRFAEVYIC